MPQLRTLQLRGCSLAGELDSGFGRLPLLQDLDLNGNQLVSVPGSLADGCAKLKTLDLGNNPLADKKLLKLANSVQAKPILKQLRGGSKAQAKQSARLVPREPPARLFNPSPALSGSPAENDTAESSGGGKRKKGKPKRPAASTLQTVLISRAALSVRPHVCFCLLHVTGGCSELFFAPECELPTGADQERFEASLDLLVQSKLPDLADGEEDCAYTAAVTAQSRFQQFISIQTRIHSDSGLGDKRRNGALGSHNASALAEWPLEFDAVEHEQVVFKPLSLGWMESKGRMTATEFCSHCVRADPHLKQHALALLQSPLCPVFRTGELVLSVPPLSNGYESRTTADCTSSVLLECSSDVNEASCRRMLMQLIRDTIELIEGGDGEHSVLVEPVQVACGWNSSRVLSHFPSYDELEALPPINVLNDQSE